MLGVLYPVCLDHLYLVADLHREEHAVNGITLLDLLQDPRIPRGELRRFVKTFFYCFKKFVFYLSGHNIWFYRYFISFSNRLILRSSLAAYRIRPSRMITSTVTTT